MDYETRKVKWYWLTLFLIYSSGVVYLIFKGNPLLYSHLELRSSLTSGAAKLGWTIPTTPSGFEKITDPTGINRFTLSRAATDPTGAPRSKNYEEYYKQTLSLGVDDFDPVNISQDRSGFYLSGQSPWVIAVDLEGNIRWKYRFKTELGERKIFPVLLDDKYAYIVHPTEGVVCLNKNTGAIVWITSLKTEIVTAPILWNENVLLPTKSATGIQFRLVKRASGKVLNESPQFDVKQPNAELSYSESLKALIMTVGSKVIAIHPTDWNILWTQTVTDPIVGPAVVVGNQIFLATLGAKVLKIDGGKKGKLDWEADLEGPAASPPAFAPVIGRIGVLDSSGGLTAIDSKTGKVYWRAMTENKNPANEPLAARVSGKYIEEFGMDWLHKGWSFWAPCGDSRFCIYSGNKGLIVNRLHLNGKPMSLPLPLEKRWVFFTRQKGGKFAISHMVEESEVKRLKGIATE